MEHYWGTLVRWLLLPLALLIIGGLLYFVATRLLGWRKRQAIGLALVS
ncbi:putative sugar ABC transporter permease, partial [Paenibacillus sp. 598K]